MPEIESGGQAVIVNLSAVTVNGVASMTARDTFGNIDILLGEIEGASGSAGNDTLIGGDGHFNRLDGFSGNDLLIGGSQSEHLIGGEGDNSLNGGTGENFYEGGKGQDNYTGGNADSDNQWDKISYEHEDGGVGIKATYKGNGKVTVVDTSATPRRALTSKK